MTGSILIGFMAFAVAMPRAVVRGRIAAIIACGVVATVFVALFAFVHPAADDFCCACAVRGQGWLGSQIASYRGWSGRVLPVALMSTVMVVPGVAMYRIAGVGLLAASGLTAAALLRALFPSHVSRRQALLGAAAFTCLRLALMPSPVEGLYWLSGALCYQTGPALGMLAFALVLRRQDEGCRRLLPLAWLAAFAAGTCSETTDGLLGVVMVVAAALRWRATRAMPWAWIGLIACLVGGAALLAAAPGNANRLHEIGDHPRPPAAFAWRIALAPYGDIQQVLGSPAAWFAALAAVCWGASCPGRRVPTLLVILTAYAAVALALAPALWVVGFAPPRAHDATVEVLLVAWLALGVGLGRSFAEPALRAKPWIHWLPCLAAIAAMWLLWSMLGPSSSEEERLAAGAAAIALALAAARWRRSAPALDAAWVRDTAALCLAATLVTCGTVPTAISDLLWRANSRDRELTTREAWLTHNAPELRARGAIVRVPLPDPQLFPSTITFNDIGAAPQSWINQAYAVWFRVPGIAVDPRIHTLDPDSDP